MGNQRTWDLHQTAKSYGQRPSALLKIRSSWTAYQFDEAVALFGRVVESRMQEMVKRGEKLVHKYTPEQALGLAPRVISISGMLVKRGVQQMDV